MFSFAKRCGIVDDNPCTSAIVPKTGTVRERFLIFAELAQLGKACDEPEAKGMNAKVLNITRLLALTGCRRDEILTPKWTEVDFNRGLLVLDETKTGRSIRPLAASAAALLRRLSHRRDASSPYVFPSHESGDVHYQGTKTLWPQIVK